MVNVMQKKCLSLQQVLRLNDKPVYIEHKELGCWSDHADGVYTLHDMSYLYLERTDTWLDCNGYGNEWLAYTIGECHVS